MTLALINSFAISNKSQKPSGLWCRGSPHAGHTYYTIGQEFKKKGHEVRGPII